ncbi:hypothetical protein GEV33_005907 [Tenebrio molitor]|uniref:Phorbol-ester/DAG-type domain-containing protein n=1 Tax=Tenebrio molitor TaxID=7067 RepID=A0A8J6HLI9_TENMO|nr:hypothetical protein GEV33_005907 [Tenebrio molitor]
MRLRHVTLACRDTLRPQNVRCEFTVKIWRERWLGDMASVAGSTEQPPAAHGHSFCKKTFHKPTYCHHCSDMLWGLIQQGFICEGEPPSRPSSEREIGLLPKKSVQSTHPWSFPFFTSFLQEQIAPPQRYTYFCTDNTAILRKLTLLRNKLSKVSERRN